jgi:Protein of unknown function (DUF1203)
MHFRVSGLASAQFAALYGLSDAELQSRGAMRIVADPTGRYPCRVSLRDAPAGDSVLLLNFEHLPTSSPYRSRYAIYVREYAVDAHPDVDEVPEIMQRRPLALRAFDRDGMLIAATLAQDETLVPAIARLLGDSRAQTLHVHNAMHGCYVAQVARA